MGRKKLELETIIAERTIDLLPEDGNTSRSVVVRLGKPKQLPDESVFRCYFQIIGMGNEEVRYGEGSDAMQALILALTKIGSHLYTSDEACAGRLSLMGSKNLNFPSFVSDYSSDLVPEPNDKLLL